MESTHRAAERGGPTLFRVLVLGPVVVERDGEPVDIGGPKPTLLLALLTAVPDQVVSADSLIDGLWGDDPPTTARKALQVHVSNLRRALGSDFPLRTSGGGYVLDRDRLDIDAIGFESELATAVASLPADPRRARDQAVAALGAVARPADLIRFAVPAGLPIGIGGGPYGIIGIPYEQGAFAEYARSLAARVTSR